MDSLYAGFIEALMTERKTIPQFFADLGAHAKAIWDGFGVGPIQDTTVERVSLAFAVTGGTVARLEGTRAREMWGELYFQARWAQYGFPLFQLTHGLASALLLTDCRTLTGSDFRLPFPAFIVGLPYPDGPLDFVGHEGKKVPARWITLHRFRQATRSSTSDEFDRRVGELLYLTSGPKEYIERARALKAEYEGKIAWVDSLVLHVYDERGIAVYSIQHGLGPDEPVERWIRDCSYTKSEDRDPYFNASLTDLDRLALGAAARIVANLVVYMRGQRETRPVEPGVEPSSPLPFLPKSGRESLARIWVVGKEVKLPKHLRDAAKAYAERGHDKARWRVRARFIVRGHWRNQACGPGRKDHRKRYIEPFWKGPPDSGTALTRLYDAATAEERKKKPPELGYDKDGRTVP